MNRPLLFRHFRIDAIVKIYKDYIVPAFMSEHRKSIALQLKELLWVLYKTKYWPYNYFKYDGYKKDFPVEKILLYVPGRLFDCLLEDVINDPTATNLIENKYLFKIKLISAGISTPKLHGKYVSELGFFDDHGQSIEERKLFNRVQESFVIKPVTNTAWGDGVKVVHIDPKVNNVYVVDNKEIGRNDFADFLKYHADLLNREILIEDKLVQHPQISRIYEKSVNTVRVITIRSPDGDLKIVSAIFRVGQGGRTIDNWSARPGGIAIGVNKESGQLMHTGYDYFRNKFTEHPDSNIAFDSITLPRWPKIRDLVVASSELFPLTNTVGWDIAIGETEPYVIEGNVDYDTKIMQVADRPFFANREFSEICKQYVQRSELRSHFEKYFNS